MARKRYSDEDCLKILRQVEVELAVGADVATACWSAGISDATFYTRRKKFGSMGLSLPKTSSGNRSFLVHTGC